MDKVRAGALRRFGLWLDPYSTYLTPEQVREYNENGKDNQVGIGAELSQVASYLYVIAPMKGSPADQAGVRAGDIIGVYRLVKLLETSLSMTQAIAQWNCWVRRETTRPASER